RREPRFPLDVPAVLTVVGSVGMVDVAVQLVDISASGLGLFSPSAVPVGACVEIGLDLGLLFGEVCHCKPTDGRFRLGLTMYHLLARNDEIRPDSEQQRFAW